MKLLTDRLVQKMPQCWQIRIKLPSSFAVTLFKLTKLKYREPLAVYSSLLQETVINFRFSFGVVNMPMYEIYFKYYFSSMQNIESFPFKCETRLFGENKRDLKEYPKIIQSFSSLSKRQHTIRQIIVNKIFIGFTCCCVE